MPFLRGASMMGETVTVFLPTLKGSDRFGNAVWDFEPHEVGNCLVRPLDGGESSGERRPESTTGLLCIAFPKSFTASLSGAKVALSDRGEGLDDAYEVRGNPVPVKPSPTEWDRLATVGRVDG